MQKPYATRFPAFVYMVLSVVFSTCHNKATAPPKLFTLISPQKSGVHFNNMVEDTEDFNIIDYLYYYNGGGVAVGDINNDGLPDIYFTGNNVPNKLYLNKGNFQFEDITDKSGAGGPSGWKTGVTMADVNGDGFLDIYVCYLGDYLNKKGRNQLFMNNHDNTFTEEAKQYGLDNIGFSTQAVFFDYDNDGDLDMYQLNHSVHSNRNYGDTSLRRIRDPLAGDELFKNDNGHFTDVSKQAGILGSPIGYGLGIAVGDINNDGWLDIYISNDFHENDYLYYNNGDGTFTEGVTKSMGHTSRFSMGNDMADFNNDGYPDLMVLDMLPEKEELVKTSPGDDPYDIYKMKLSFGYYYQYSRNTLQLNMPANMEPDKKGVKKALFSEIGQLAGVSATDWSWSPLFTNLDNDGFKDLFITNGILRRPNDMDYLKYVSNEEVQQAVHADRKDVKKKLISRMPSEPVSNYAYHNGGNLTFSNKAAEWGLDRPGFSNGAAYADLDGDGDMDLIVNNINSPASVYRNESNHLNKNHNLKIKLQGSNKNTFGLGAKIIINHQGKIFYQEQMPTRGFESSVDPFLNFGLGNLSEIDSLTVIWPGAKYQTLTHIPTNQSITLQQKNAIATYNYDSGYTSKTLFTDVTEQWNIRYQHKENNYTDFNAEPLIPHMLSTEGPKIATGDVDGDGLEDFFAGGAKGAPGKLFLQQKSGKFIPSNDKVWRADSLYEDTGCAFFDADNDGDLDLIILSGGNESSASERLLQPRLYLNNGKGIFTKGDKQLPPLFINGSCVVPGDYDKDGDMDLFMGSSSVPGKYGISPASYLLQNDGKGNFKDVTNSVAPELSNIGMVTCGIWADIDGDKKKELIITGEWMPITIFKNISNKLVNITKKTGLENTEGWWNCIQAGDFDKDGDMDFILGNLGLNANLKASVIEPVQLYIKDFDNNGKPDPIITYYKQHKKYPLPSMDELFLQIPSLKKASVKYLDYAKKGFHDIFKPSELKGAIIKRVVNFKTSYLENLGNGAFAVKDLPIEAQFAPVRSILCGDFNKDGKEDILLGGNFYAVPPKTGRYDASYGTLLLGDGKGKFSFINARQSGVVLTGEVRDMKRIELSKGKEIIIAGKNNDYLQVLMPDN